MQRIKTKGVFCLEGDWDKDLRVRTSVQPVLQLLEQSGDPPISSIRRDVGTIEEFEYYLKKWCLKRYQRYPILYLGFHGSPEVLYVGDRSTHVDLDWLEERLDGKCAGSVIHFGSCSTMATHGSRLNRFLKRTKALAVCGYKVDVGWMKSAAFEIMVLNAFQGFSLTRQGMAAVQRQILSEAPGLARDLSFRMVISKAR